MRPPKPTSGGGGRGGEGTFTRAFPSCETTARDTTGAAVTSTPASPVVCTRSSVAAPTVPAASMSRARAASRSAPLATGNFNTKGGQVGGTLGYNYQVGQTVLGLGYATPYLRQFRDEAERPGAARVEAFHAVLGGTIFSSPINVNLRCSSS